MLKLNNDGNDLLRIWVSDVADDYADKLLVEHTAEQMTKRLHESRKQGRYGWFGPERSNKQLMEYLKKNLEEGDMVDVINLAAMIHARKRLYGHTA